MTTTRPASGEQWSLRHGDDVVTVVEVGGGLRSWTRVGAHVLAGYAAGEMCLAGRGQVLFPWPNRVRDGAYVHAGTRRQLALTEPRLGNATHGLVRWLPWRVVDRCESSVTVACELHPQPGWEWPLDLSVTYALTGDGLVVTPVVTNPGATAAPFGLGFHPYVSIGDTPVADLHLTIPGTSFVTLGERLLPTGVEPVAGTAVDFRDGRAIGDAVLDTAYGDLTVVDGRWGVLVDGLADLPRVTVWGEPAYRWVQVFTGKAAAEGQHGIAVEPTTCPPDALNSGVDLLTLEPGGRWTARWGISLG